jgi:hypothetical protein
MNGTSIQDLNVTTDPHYYDSVRQLQDAGQTNYNAGQNSHYEQGHNAAHHMHQAQHMPYSDNKNIGGYPQFINQQDAQYPGYNVPVQKPQEVVDIEELARELNQNIGEDTFSSVSESSELDGGFKSSVINSIPEMIREPLLILIIYLLLSQAVVKDFFAKYITQLRPDAECKISFTGVVIYGVLLAVLYSLAKKFIL